MPKTKTQSLKNITFWSLFLFIAFTALGGVMNKIEAYEGEQRQNSLLSISNTVSHQQNQSVSREIDEVSKEESPLCELDVFVCPNEEQGTIREISAYNSVSEQTDASPCISADGTNICERYEKGECIVATNAYPLKTKLRIDHIGDCTVADRMNARYSNRVDIFMDKDIERAIHFGVQKLNVVEL